MTAGAAEAVAVGTKKLRPAAPNFSLARPLLGRPKTEGAGIHVNETRRFLSWRGVSARVAARLVLRLSPPDVLWQRAGRPGQRPESPCLRRH